MTRQAWSIDGNVSLPSRGAWIEIVFSSLDFSSKGSLPSRGAWIEIYYDLTLKEWRDYVAPLAGSVDRNNKEKQRFLEVEPVAPLAGSVDRNPQYPNNGEPYKSLPSRGAWIEIRITLPKL